MQEKNLALFIHFHSTSHGQQFSVYFKSFNQDIFVFIGNVQLIHFQVSICLTFLFDHEYITEKNIKRNVTI